MVIGDSAVVEYALALLKLTANQRTCAGTHIRQVGNDARTLRIEVIGQEPGIHTRVTGQLLLIQALEVFQGRVSREAELPVTIDLQRGEVVELGRLFATSSLLHIFYDKRATASDNQGIFRCLE